jgi:hypothetical protein
MTNEHVRDDDAVGKVKSALEVFPGYVVSPSGDVISIASNWRGYGARKLAHQPNDDGYPSVRVIVDGKRKRFAVHILVAAVFLPPRPSPNHEIRHLDGNKENCHASNLMWGTRKENAEDRERHGRTSRGERHSRAVRGSCHAEAVRAFWSRRRANHV